MYKVSSDKRQAGLHHGRPSDWINGEERLSANDQLLQLRQNLKTIESRIFAAPAESELRRQLGREKNAVQLQIKEWRANMPKAPPDWKMHFVNEARRILSDGQFKMIENAAKIEAQREQERRDKIEQEKSLPNA